ncbi:MAG: nicotinate-nucleotide adenylyltransferase [Nitratireductor sp.]|nr:nicotinate-nucleotide adenylyltransferase [Nitratireductor sp.]
MARYMRFPHCEPGMAIGLFGGSFNPPHEGHVHVSELALRRARLDRIWWIVTPGNPLKDHSELAPLTQRLDECAELARNPAFEITAFEARFNIRYTADTLAIVVRRFPKVRFVWIMGADNLAGFHRWQNWRRIASLMPILVIDRPGSTLSVRSAPAALALARYRIREAGAGVISSLRPPVWAFIHGPRNSLSSTAIRRSGRARRPSSRT